MIFNVTEILAIGFNKRFMCVFYPDFGFKWVRISDQMYRFLKQNGVITSQAKRFKKVDCING